MGLKRGEGIDTYQDKTSEGVNAEWQLMDKGKKRRENGKGRKENS